MKTRTLTIMVLMSLFIGMLLGASMLHSCQEPLKPIIVKELETITEVIPDEATQRQLNKIMKENEELNARLKEIAAKPRIIIQKEIIMEGAEYEEANFPSHFVYRNADGLVVSEHSFDEKKFKAKVYDIEVKTKDVISEDKKGNTVVHSETKVSTSYDETEVTILTEPKVLIKREGTKLRFQPLLEMGVTADLAEPLSPGLHLNTGGYVGIAVDTKKAEAWMGVGLDISNRDGPRPALKVQVKF